jgi:neprilysin
MKRQLGEKFRHSFNHNYWKNCKFIFLRVFKNYLFWRVADHSTFFLSVELKKASLKFHEKLYGRQRLEEQWKRCVDRVKRLFAISVAAMLANNDNSSIQDRVEANNLIQQIKLKVEGLIHQMPIPEEPKKKLAERMASVEILAGYPQEFYDETKIETYYEDMVIYDGKFFQTVFSAEQFLNKKYGERISKSIKDTQWQSFLDSSFEKSYYSRARRTIYVHQRDLKSPLFNVELPNYINFARLGWQVANLYGIAIVFEVILFLFFVQIFASLLHLNYS